MPPFGGLPEASRYAGGVSLESYFASPQRTALHNTDYRTPSQIEQGLSRGTQYLNENPRPYKWKKV